MTVNSLEAKLDKETLSLIEEEIEKERCSLNPVYFFQNYVKLQDRAKKQTVSWESWPYLVELLDLFLVKKELVILKARQLGISWLVAGYCLWLAIFNRDVKALFFSQGETEAQELVKKCKFIWEHLPDFLRPESGHDALGFMDFPELKSEIKAFASTEKAGRSTDATIVVRDELEQHPEAERNFAAIGPTVDAGGQLIDLSTADGTKMNTHFKVRFNEARAGQNTAYPVFLPVTLRPEREPGMPFDEWFAKMKRKYPAWIIEREYPMNEIQALGVVESGCFFDKNALEIMLMDTDIPILETRHSGCVRIFKKPIVGRKYAITLDPSGGRDDPHALVCVDIQTYEEVACSHGYLPAEQCALILDELVREYNDALNTFELNAVGFAVQQKLRDLGTPNQYHHEKKLDKTGVWTGHSLKLSTLWALEGLIRKNQIRVHSKEAINDFRSFLQVKDVEMPEKAKGTHDDFVDAWRLFGLIAPKVPVGGGVGFESWIRDDLIY